MRYKVWTSHDLDGGPDSGPAFGGEGITKIAWAGGEGVKGAWFGGEGAKTSWGTEGGEGAKIATNDPLAVTAESTGEPLYSYRYDGSDS